MKNKHLVFVYGTLKHGYCNNMLLRSSTFIGEAITCEPMYMYSYGVPMVAIPSDEEIIVQALPIIGEAYIISKKTLQNLDILEGHPDIYIRILKKIQIGNKNKQAYIYVKNNKRWTALEQDMSYNEDGSFKNIRIIDNKYEWVGGWRDWL